MATRSSSLNPSRFHSNYSGAWCGITGYAPSTVLAGQHSRQYGSRTSHSSYHVSHQPCRQTCSHHRPYTAWTQTKSSHTGHEHTRVSWGVCPCLRAVAGRIRHQDLSAMVQCHVGRAMSPARSQPATRISQAAVGWKHLDLRLSTDSALGSAPREVSSSPTTRKTVRTLLIDNYDSYTYNLYQLLAVINGAPPVTIFNDQMLWDDLKPLLVGPARAFDNVVISPGPGTPARPADTGVCPRLFLECPDLPILGVCLGHQLLAHVHGASVTHAPEPVHGRLSDLEHSGHRLFQGIPSDGAAGVKVVRYHSLAVDHRTLPPHLIPTAWTVPGVEPSTNAEAHGDVNPASGNDVGSSNDRHRNENGNKTAEVGLSTRVPTGAILMGLSHRILPHHGVQYHPESVATTYGERLLRNFYAMTVEHWAQLRRSGRAGLVNGQHANWSHLLRKGEVDLAERERRPSGMTTSSGQAQAERRLTAAVPGCRGQGQYRVAWTKVASVLHDGCGPEEVFMALYGQEGGQDAFWLDSSSIEEGRGRFSFVGGKGGRLWRKVTYVLKGTAGGGGQVRVEDGQGNTTGEKTVSSIFDYLEEELALRRCPDSDTAALPFDFCGGFVGYLGYELKLECGAAANKHTSQLPDAAFFLVDRLVVIDHSDNDVYVLELLQDYTEGTERGTAMPGAEKLAADATAPAEAEISGQNGKRGEGDVVERVESTAWINETAARIRRLSAVDGAAFVHRSPLPQDWEQRGRGAALDDEHEDATPEAAQYVADVEACMEEIQNGESYEVCLTTRLHPSIPVASPLALYRHLRHANPAPYSAWMAFGEAGPALVCCSPERFLKLDRHGTLEAKPIKGTSRRSRDPDEDAQLREALRSSPKEWAENLMIVDLLRNDLGKVCQVGSVHVPRLMAVESFATVHQLVSTVRGKKREDLGPLACVRAAFPGGSMTGAPKVRTMDIIDAIERTPRGVYSGALGFFSVNGTFDLNVVIRTATWQHGRVSIGAGGAVVSLSDPAAEYAEMLLKAQALLTAVAESSAAKGDGWAS